MFNSDTISGDHLVSGKNSSSRSSFLVSNPTNHNGAFKGTDFVGSSDSFYNQIGSSCSNNNLQQQGSGGLARYRSAPSSYFEALLDSTNTDSSTCDDDELFSSLVSGPAGVVDHKHNHDHQMQIPTKQEFVGAETEPRPRHNGSSDGQTGYDPVVGSYSMGLENQVHMRSSLVRHSSSPAGFFNGYDVVGEAGNYKLLQNHGEANSSASGLSNHMNFSAARSSSKNFMPSIPEYRNQNFATSKPENDSSGNGNNADGSWNQTPSLKRNQDGDLKMLSNFNGLENLNVDAGKNTCGLVHHLSLPKTSAEMASVENYLNFKQETPGVPCQLRAKRGFATHPRSIAERVRRSRITDKMKTLQDLFPDLDKQTSQADMLDSVVECIKDLQKQVQMFNDMKAKCVCSSNKRQQTTPTS